MKKLVAVLLIIALTLSATACGKKNDEEMMYTENVYEDFRENWNTTESALESAEAEPTEEEEEALNRFFSIIDGLGAGDGGYYDNATGIYYYGSEGYGYYYEELKNLEIVDKWFGTEYAPEVSRQEILARFTVIEDVLLGEKYSKYDRMGNTLDPQPYQKSLYRYNEEGKVVAQMSSGFEQVTTDPLGVLSWCGKVLDYDENGRITKISYGSLAGVEISLSEVSIRSVPTYDANGKLVSEAIESNDYSGTIAYTYDDRGNITEILCTKEYFGSENSNHNVYTYTYDENNNVLSEKEMKYRINEEGKMRIESIDLKEYTYDEQGYLTAGKHISQIPHGDFVEDIHANVPVYKETINQYTFTCDEQGRIKTMTILFGETTYPSASQSNELPDYATEEIEFVYGNYFIYSTTNE